MRLIYFYLMGLGERETTIVIDIHILESETGRGRETKGKRERRGES